MLIPSESETEGALLVSLRREITGPARLTESEEEFADLATEAMRSLEYDTP